MSTARTRLALALSGTAIFALALAGCASSDPISGGDGPSEEPGGSSTIVIGSQAYYSNEIIAEIYAQALEGAGFEVERNFNIGQRDAYMPAIEDGSIDLFPEYTGNLLQFFDPVGHRPGLLQRHRRVRRRERPGVDRRSRRHRRARPGWRGRAREAPVRSHRSAGGLRGGCRVRRDR
jgi:hypothetical protein